LAAARRLQLLLFEVRLLHQPVREAAKQVGIRPSSLVAAGPQPGVVGEDHAHPTLPALADHEQRTVLSALPQDFGVARVGIDNAEPAAPTRLWAARAGQIGRHWMLLAKLGEHRLEWLFDYAARRHGGQNLAERGGIKAERAGGGGAGPPPHGP